MTTTAPADLAAADALLSAGQWAEAEAAYRAWLAVRPDDDVALTHLGVCLHQQGRAEEALTPLDRAVALAPTAPEGWHNRGDARRAVGRAAEAEADYRRAAALRPQDPAYPCNRALALRDLGRLEEARESLQLALTLDPTHGPATVNLGVVLTELDRPGEAAPLLEAALRRAPRDAAAAGALGCALRDLGRIDDAFDKLMLATQLDPDDSAHWCSLGALLLDLGKPRQAEACLRRALTLTPDDPEAEWNLALALLARTSFFEGWERYESRRRRRGWVEPGFSAPDWDGQELPKGSTLLVWCEQGFGDALMMAQWLRPAAQAAKAKLAVAAPKALISLFKASFPQAEIVDLAGPYPDHAAQIPIMSLPWRLNLIPRRTSSGCPYLSPMAEAVSRWRARFSALPGRKIGLVWAGNAQRMGDDRRSLADAALLGPILDTPDVSFVSLQVGPRSVETPPGVLDLSEDLTDFHETAAATMGLDLVITVDTAVAHLCGGVGRPAAVLVPYGADWRWLGMYDDRGETSMWRRTLRMYRQPQPLDWASPIRTIAASLRSERAR